MTASAPALPTTMRGVIMHAARDIRVEDREVPHVIEPTDEVLIPNEWGKSSDLYLGVG